MSLEAFVMRKELRKDMNRLESRLAILEQQVNALMTQRQATRPAAQTGREAARVAGHNVMVDPAHATG